MQVAACAHLLNQWLEEDAPEHEARDARLLVDLRERTDHPAVLGITSLLNSGVFPALSPDGPTREPLSCVPIPVSEAATAIERALFGTPASRRVGLMYAALRALIHDWAEEAVLVTVTDPAGGGVPDETHVVFTFFSRLIRVSVARVGDRGIGHDPACSFAGHWCESDPRLERESHALAEARLRAICAGAALRAPLDLYGYASFKVGWMQHELPSSADMGAVREWWSSTAWSQRYVNDYLLDELSVPDDPQAQDDDPDDRVDAIKEPHPLELGDPANDHAWWGGTVGGGLQSLETMEFLTEVEAFRAACLEEATGNESSELVSHLLDELLDGPIRRMGGPERRLRVWADADEDGRFWRDVSDGIFRCGHGRRLLILGPDEAMYIVFKEEQNE
ncbi:hypothetical protein [Nonomuraea roseola]|uniref:DUF1963 domain-containing protein n=1 Tax=Nonomuraea roseola TaxID=46179 RepID=A0ABV5PS02_9ACTN